MTGLMERRALEAAFGELAETNSLDELTRRAQAIADHGHAALPVFLAALDSADPTLRGGLGLVAQHMARDVIVPALRAAIRSRECTDQARISALTILDRYLHEPVDAGLLATLRDPDGVALQSLRELIGAMAQTPTAIIEYLEQLTLQPPDVPGQLMHALPRLLPDPHLVTLLRMFAQGEDGRLAQQALDLLGRTRTAEAAQALVTLAATVPPERTALAERGVRKLRLSGVQPLISLPVAAWQTLISPIDGAGTQTLWFICPQADSDRAHVLTIVTQDPLGVIACSGALDALSAEIPPAVPLGEILAIPQLGDRRPLMLLATSFDVGRLTLQRALSLNWNSKQPTPLPYRLFNDLIWQYGLPKLSDTAEPPSEIATEPMPNQAGAALLDHPAFAGWFWQSAALYDAAENLGTRHPLEDRSVEIVRLARLKFDAPELTSYQRRLTGMAEWLRLAGEPVAANWAAAEALRLTTEPPEASRLIRRLIGIGLDIANINLRSGYDLRRET